MLLTRSKLFSPSRTRPFTLTISVKQRLAPLSRARSRIGRLVMPAMGARKRGLASVSAPIFTVWGMGIREVEYSVVLKF